MGSIPGSGRYPVIIFLPGKVYTQRNMDSAGATKNWTQLRDGAHNTFTHTMSLNSSFTSRKSCPESKLVSGSAKTHLCASDPRAMFSPLPCTALSEMETQNSIMQHAKAFRVWMQHQNIRRKRQTNQCHLGYLAARGQTARDCLFHSACRCLHIIFSSSLFPLILSIPS